MASDVYVVRTGSDLRDVPDRVGRLADAARLSEIVEPGHFYMVKVHFGEPGNNTFINPLWMKPLVSRLKQAGAKVCIGETNALYVGARSNAVDHLTVARDHGFTHEALGAPVIIADGLVGENQSPVEVNLKHYRQVNIANDARAADAFVVVSNITGHVLTGYAGAMKNVGMGLAGRGGKRSQHCDLNPEVLAEKCTACGTCVQWCPTGAISVDEIARIDGGKCIGCGECYAVCRFGAIRFQWSETSANMQEKMVEHCVGALKSKRGVSLYVNFLTAVTQNCNCMGHTEEPEVEAVGIAASTDIVAVDQASVDLVNQAAGEDLFKRMYPSWDYTIQLSYAEQAGLGSRKYKLHEVS